MILALAACGGGSSRATAPGAVSGNAPDPGDGWEYWSAATATHAALTEPARTAARLLRDGDRGAEAFIDDLRTEVSRRQTALEELASAVDSSTCTLPSGADREDVLAIAEAAVALVRVLEGRALLALHDGDHRAAVRDIEVAIGVPRAWRACRTGVHATVEIERGVLDTFVTARAVGLAVDGDLRERVISAAENASFTRTEVTAALADDDAHLAHGEIEEVSYPDMAYFIGAVSDARSGIDELMAVLAAHPSVYDVDATIALLDAGIADLASRLPDAYGPDDLTAPEMDKFDALMAELGPAAALFQDPASLQSGVPPKTVTAFHAVSNPFGRFLAAFVLGQEAAALSSALRLADEVAKDQRRLLVALRD
jgi:hypothetical protein